MTTLMAGLNADELVRRARKKLEKLPDYNPSPSNKEWWDLEVAKANALAAIALYISQTIPAQTELIFEIKEEEDDDQG